MTDQTSYWTVAACGWAHPLGICHGHPDQAAQPAPLDERYRALVEAAHEVDRTHHTDSPAAYPAEMGDHIRRGNAALLALRAALAALEDSPKGSDAP